MLSSDHQIPYQDDRAIDLWFQVMDWYKPHVIDYLGDTSDQFCFSTYEKGRTKEFLNSIPEDSDAKKLELEEQKERLLNFVKIEEKPVADFYEFTRKKRKNAEIFSALGNHDIRIWNYADQYMKEILNEITPESLWGLDNLGIDYIYYEELPRLRYGGLYAHHGISAPTGSGAAVKSDITNLGISLIRGHSHRMGTYYKTYELRNETLRGYEIGHMCKVDSGGFKYAHIHDWQQGFAVGLISGDQVHIQLVEILPDYTCWVAGKKFSA
jgi:hypothetical protein